MQSLVTALIPLLQMPCFFSLVLQSDGVEGVALRWTPEQRDTLWSTRESLFRGTPIEWDVSVHTQEAHRVASRCAQVIAAGVDDGTIDLGFIGAKGLVTRWDWVTEHGTSWAAADGW